eukprot:TRINITY_DN8539_c0_g1_i10.p1 TRINITY_DN8539_c0_g1~~TRINITY_DN8539_c0_g1_i10.p1  ORF type:complete len:249 (+),score=50.51 TRINITY_DN8539_c0_g1_i10:62-748(+)
MCIRDRYRDVIVWRVTQDYRIQIRTHYNDHHAMITAIYYSKEARLFTTSSVDGKVNVYHSITGEFMRTIFHPKMLPINNMVITTSPLVAIVFYSIEDHTIYSYSINGFLIDSVTHDTRFITSPIVVKNTFFVESLIYGNENGEIYIRDLPLLTLRKKFIVSMQMPVISIVTSRDKKYLLCACGDGEISVLTDPNQSASINPTQAPPTMIASSSMNQRVEMQPQKKQQS